MRGWWPRCLARAGLKEEYERAAEWVRTSMPVNASFDASVFETIIRVVGGTLAAHDLTGDQVMLQRWVVAGGRSCRPRGANALCHPHPASLWPKALSLPLIACQGVAGLGSQVAQRCGSWLSLHTSCQECSCQPQLEQPWAA